METKKTNVKISELEARLIQLVFEMSESEAIELLGKLEKRKKLIRGEKEKRKYPRNSTFSHVECSGRHCAFTDFIQNISSSGLYSEVIELLGKLEKREKLIHGEREKRKYPRNSTFIHVECSGDYCTFTDFIQNISDGGLFIETQIPLFTGLKLFLIFSPNDFEDPIKISGTIVRTDSKGIAIQFDKPISTINPFI